MSSFENALANVLEAEAGYVNNPHDRGGPTKYGITFNSWTAFYGRPASLSDIQALTPESVAPIYKKLYWDPLQLDALDCDLALIVFNQAVLRGPVATVKCLQSVLGIKNDGVMGPKTISATNSADKRILAFRFLRASHEAYLRIAAKSPNQAIFVNGWSNRVFDLIESIILKAPMP